VFVFYALHGARWERAASLAGIAIAVLASYSVWRESEGIAAGCLFSGMMLALYRLDAAIAGMASLGWLHWCGVVSYSLYLTHQLVCSDGHKWLRENGLESPLERLLIVVPICVTGSLLLAWPFHYFIERRFMPAPKATESRAASGEHKQQTDIASSQTLVS
jgi:peptidoglycan/LPS O-acetylase OafA/YrhL